MANETKKALLQAPNTAKGSAKEIRRLKELRDILLEAKAQTPTFGGWDKLQEYDQRLATITQQLFALENPEAAQAMASLAASPAAQGAKTAGQVGMLMAPGMGPSGMLGGARSAAGKGLQWLGSKVAGPAGEAVAGAAAPAVTQAAGSLGKKIATGAALGAAGTLGFAAAGPAIDATRRGADKLLGNTDARNELSRRQTQEALAVSAAESSKTRQETLSAEKLRLSQENLKRDEMITTELAGIAKRPAEGYNSIMQSTMSAIGYLPKASPDIFSALGIAPMPASEMNTAMQGVQQQSSAMP